MDFPPFEHLLYYERVHGARLNISYSNIREFRLDGFRRGLPKNLDLNWTFRNGTPGLRELIAKRHRTSSRHVLVTTGATEANFLVNASLVRPKDRVLVDIPIYSPLRDVPRGVGAAGPRLSGQGGPAGQGKQSDDPRRESPGKASLSTIYPSQADSACPYATVTCGSR